MIRHFLKLASNLVTSEIHSILHARFTLIIARESLRISRFTRMFTIHTKPQTFELWLGLWLGSLMYPHHNALEWESKFTLGLNTAKNTDYIEKCFKQNLHNIKFPVKNSADAYLYLLQDRS